MEFRPTKEICEKIGLPYEFFKTIENNVYVSFALFKVFEDFLEVTCTLKNNISVTKRFEYSAFKESPPEKLAQIILSRCR